MTSRENGGGSTRDRHRLRSLLVVASAWCHDTESRPSLQDNGTRRHFHSTCRIEDAPGICSYVCFLEVAGSRRRVCRIIIAPMKTMQQVAAFTFLATGLITVASAAPNDWAEGTGGRGGASREYYNSAGSLAWKNRLGDWRDAHDAAQGDASYAVAAISGLRRERLSNGMSRRSCRSGAAGPFPARGSSCAWSKARATSSSPAVRMGTPLAGRNWCSPATRASSRARLRPTPISTAPPTAAWGT